MQCFIQHKDDCADITLLLSTIFFSFSFCEFVFNFIVNKIQHIFYKRESVVCVLSMHVSTHCNSSASVDWLRPRAFSAVSHQPLIHNYSTHYYSAAAERCFRYTACSTVNCCTLHASSV